MRHCTVAYAYYESDYRVRRYAELYSEDENNIVHVISLRHEGQPNDIVCNGAKVFQIQAREQDEKTPTVYIYRIIKFIVKATTKLALLHARYRYDVIHVHNLPDFLVFCAIIPKLFGAKVILDIHDIMPELYCERFRRKPSSMMSRLLLAAEKLSVLFADYVIVANDLWKERISERTHAPLGKVISMLNYPNLGFFSSRDVEPSADKCDLVYPGHLSYQHGVDIIINAMPFILREIPFAKLYIYPITFVHHYKQELEEIIRSHKLGESIIFQEPVPPEKISNILKYADLGIVTKRGGNFGGEAFSTKILDFFAAGLPVVCSKTAIDVYYFNDDYLHFFRDGDVDDCAGKVISLWHDIQRRKQLSLNGLTFVENNNWLDKSMIYRMLVQS